MYRRCKKRVVPVSRGYPEEGTGGRSFLSCKSSREMNGSNGDQHIDDLVRAAVQYQAIPYEWDDELDCASFHKEAPSVKMGAIRHLQIGDTVGGKSGCSPHVTNIQTNSCVQTQLQHYKGNYPMQSMGNKIRLAAWKVL